MLSNMYNLHSTPSNQVLLTSKHINTLKCAWLHSISSNHVLFNSNCLKTLNARYLPRHTQNKSSSTHITLIITIAHNCTSQIQINFFPTQTNFNTLKYAQCTQQTEINTQMHQKCMQAIQSLNTNLQCALVHLQGSNLQNSEPPSTNQCPQTCSNAPTTRSTAKAPPNANANEN